MTKKQGFGEGKISDDEFYEIYKESAFELSDKLIEMSKPLKNPFAVIAMGFLAASIKMTKSTKMGKDLFFDIVDDYWDEAK